MKKTLIYSGGTFSYVRNHLALSAPAFGKTGKTLHRLIDNSELVLTKMADSSSKIVTNDDLLLDLTHRLEDKEIGCIIMNAALCDYDGQIGEIASGKHAKRLESREENLPINIKPSNKIISIIKETRPDVIVVGFKTTCNAQTEEMEFKAERMIKNSNVDFVLANDTGRRLNQIFYSSEAKRFGNTHSPISDRLKILKILSSQVSKMLDK